MSYENATALIDQLKTQLVACPAFLAVADATHVHYPAGPVDDADAFPVFVLASTAPRAAKVADGLRPLPGGELQIVITDDTSIGELEQLASDIESELLLQDTGIPWQTSSIGMAGAPDPGHLATADDASALKFYSIVITLSFGLTG